ncbi:MAG TPA: hypothetical protein H9975_02310 [Candidatus Alistipes avistercoris]|mgnify:CR=1 FL=1|nr:hypothetical protein [Candidatus Alistipes avistercoris]
MTDAESSKPQAKDGWTDAAGVTVKEGKSGSNRRQWAKRLQGRRTLVRHKAAASRHEQRNTGREEHKDKGMLAGEKPAAVHRHIEPKNKTNAR